MTICAGAIEFNKVIGVVRKVSIHLQDVSILSFKGIFETGDVGRSQTQLSLPLDKVNFYFPIRIKFLLN